MRGCMVLRKRRKKELTVHRIQLPGFLNLLLRPVQFSANNTGLFSSKKSCTKR
jgi:hypothetical protein